MDRRTLAARVRIIISVGALAVLQASCPRARGPAADVARPSFEETLERASRLRDDAARGTRAFEWVRGLTLEAGPRLAGTEGDRRGVAWALRTLREVGLSHVRSESFELDRWERGEAAAEILEPFPQPLVVTALGLSVATPADGLIAEVIRVPDLAALGALAPAAVAGRIVFFDKPMRRLKDGSGYNEAVDVRWSGPSAAARKGAVAVVIRSIGTSSHRFAHTGGMSNEKDAPKIPAAALAGPDADGLAAQIATGRPVRMRLLLRTKQPGKGRSANVIGEVRGRERPEEIVLLGAHLDSWDLGPGALDDGAGCAIVIEAARRIAALPSRPRRTIRVVLFGAEEIGIIGALAYGRAHAGEMAQHVGAVEADFGTGRVFAMRSRVGEQSLPFVRRVAELLAPLGVARGANDAQGGADLIPLRRARVPVFSLSQDGTDYFDYHHSADDTLDKVRPRDLDQAVAAFVTLAYTLADAPVRLAPFVKPAPRTKGAN
jgi:hypothetical protein